MKFWFLGNILNLTSFLKNKGPLIYKFKAFCFSVFHMHIIRCVQVSNFSIIGMFS